MEEENESILTGYPSIVSYECTKKIINQLEKTICRLKIENEQGTGFFCKIPFPNKKNMLPVLITNNHIINDEILNKNNENITLYMQEMGKKNIDLNNRITYTNKEYDITIVEILKKDEINDYLKLDEDIITDIINKKIENKNDKFIDKTMYILQYPESNLSVSYGILENICEDKNFNFRHKCSTRNGSSGSPILNINNNKIIGIHKRSKISKYNIGTFLNYPIKDFINKNINKDIKKEINAEIIDNNDINNLKNNNNDKEGLIDLSSNDNVEKYFNINLFSTKDCLSNKVYEFKQPSFKKNETLEINGKDKNEKIDLSKYLNQDLCSTKVTNIKKKNSQVNLLNLMTNIFFKNEHQTEINTQKIDENYLKILREEYLKHKNEEKNIVYIYVNNFIKTNCLKLFKENKKIEKNDLEIIKDKISSVIQCIDMNKDYYNKYYYPVKEGLKNYQSSVKAAQSFRKEFQISEYDINERILIKTLSENNNDIYQTFAIIYGK